MSRRYKKEVRRLLAKAAQQGGHTMFGRRVEDAHAAQGPNFWVDKHYIDGRIEDRVPRKVVTKARARKAKPDTSEDFKSHFGPVSTTFKRDILPPRTPNFSGATKFPPQSSYIPPDQNYNINTYTPPGLDNLDVDEEDDVDGFGVKDPMNTDNTEVGDLYGLDPKLFNPPTPPASTIASETVAPEDDRNRMKFMQKANVKYVDQLYPVPPPERSSKFPARSSNDFRVDRHYLNSPQKISNFNSPVRNSPVSTTFRDSPMPPRTPNFASGNLPLQPSYSPYNPTGPLSRGPFTLPAGPDTLRQTVQYAGGPQRYQDALSRQEQYNPQGMSPQQDPNAGPNTGDFPSGVAQLSSMSGTPAPQSGMPTMQQAVAGFGPEISPDDAKPIGSTSYLNPQYPSALDLLPYTPGASSRGQSSKIMGGMGRMMPPEAAERGVSPLKRYPAPEESYYTPQIPQGSNYYDSYHENPVAPYAPYISPKVPTLTPQKRADILKETRSLLDSSMGIGRRKQLADIFPDIFRVREAPSEKTGKLMTYLDYLKPLGKLDDATLYRIHHKLLLNRRSAINKIEPVIKGNMDKGWMMQAAERFPEVFSYSPEQSTSLQLKKPLTQLDGATLEKLRNYFRHAYPMLPTESESGGLNIPSPYKSYNSDPNTKWWEDIGSKVPTPTPYPTPDSTPNPGIVANMEHDDANDEVVSEDHTIAGELITFDDPLPNSPEQSPEQSPSQDTSTAVADPSSQDPSTSSALSQSPEVTDDDLYELDPIHTLWDRLSRRIQSWDPKTKQSLYDYAAKNYPGVFEGIKMNDIHGDVLHVKFNQERNAEFVINEWEKTNPEVLDETHGYSEQDLRNFWNTGVANKSINPEVLRRLRYRFPSIFHIPGPLRADGDVDTKYAINQGALSNIIGSKDAPTRRHFLDALKHAIAGTPYTPSPINRRKLSLGASTPTPTPTVESSIPASSPSPDSTPGASITPAVTESVISSSPSPQYPQTYGYGGLEHFRPTLKNGITLQSMYDNSPEGLEIGKTIAWQMNNGMPRDVRNKFFKFANEQLPGILVLAPGNYVMPDAIENGRVVLELYDIFTKGNSRDPLPSHENTASPTPMPTETPQSSPTPGASITPAITESLNAQPTQDMDFPPERPQATPEVVNRGMPTRPPARSTAMAPSRTPTSAPTPLPSRPPVRPAPRPANTPQATPEVQEVKNTLDAVAQDAPEIQPVADFVEEHGDAIREGLPRAMGGVVLLAAIGGLIGRALFGGGGAPQQDAGIDHGDGTDTPPPTPPPAPAVTPTPTPVPPPRPAPAPQPRMRPGGAPNGARPRWW